VPGFRRRDREEASVEDEREALRRQRAEAADELERLKRELSDRVAAVRAKERQLDEALGRRPQGAMEEQKVAGGESEPTERRLPPPTLPPARPESSEELSRIEVRLAELREAERVFMRTQEELAARSEALSARERLVAERERDLDELERHAGLGPTRSELSELESRLQRLEARGTLSIEDTQTFAAGLESLRRRGTKRPPSA
jgi:predicted mannosyl-3-phosphoglycerate phosphatase (HAD superfamily)